MAQGEDGSMVSLTAQVPEPLLLAMRAFIERHPNWDQYRLFQAALAGFLVQNSVRDRAVTRCYLANLFPGSGGFQGMPVLREGRLLGSVPLRTASDPSSPLNHQGKTAA